MAGKAESAELILKLYELRREKKMRKARQWFMAWPLDSVKDWQAALQGEDSPLLRMATSYWDMASALVLHGAIDAAMFHDTTSEHILFYAKLEPFLAEFRAAAGQPSYLSRLEKVMATLPPGDERLDNFRRRLKAAREARAAAAGTAPAAATAGGR